MPKCALIVLSTFLDSMPLVAMFAIWVMTLRALHVMLACDMQEQDILKNIVVPCELNPLPVREVEIDEFDVRYTANEKMNIQNDTITLNYRLSGASYTLSYASSSSPCMP